MVLVMADSQAPVSSMTRVARSKCSALGSSEVRNPSHLPAPLLKSVTAVGCHLRVSVGAMELQATMRNKKAKPINPTIFFILHVPPVYNVGTLPVLPPHHRLSNTYTKKAVKNDSALFTFFRYQLGILPIDAKQ